jgi:signal transduction histidine kinase
VNTPSVRWWLRALALLGLCCHLGTAQGIDDSLLDAQHAVVRFESAYFRLTQDLQPPEASAIWARVALPDNWNVSLPGQGGQGWYRLRFLVNTIPQAPQAAYFPRASMNATVFLNGALIDNSGDGVFEHGVRNWNRPFLIHFSPRLLRQGSNELLIRVDAEANDMGGLSVVELGQASLLRPAYQQRRFVQLVIPQFSEVVVALVCLITFGYWLLLKDPLYGYFTLVSGAHFLRNMDYVANDFSIPVGWVQVGVAGSVCWFVIFLMLFALRLLQLNWPQVEKSLLWLSGVIALTLLVLGGSPWAAPAAMGLHVMALVLGLVALVVLMPKIGRAPYVESLPLTLAGLISFGLGVHDVLQRLGMLSTDHPRLSHLSAPVLILTMSAILFSRYVKNTLQLERTNRDLEQEVKEKSTELVEMLNAQHQLQQNQAVLQERELIMREMHDGVGNYLTIALRALSRSTPDIALLRGALKSCMLDLRLMIDSLSESDSGADTVATVLGNLRYRIEPALKSEGVQLVWEVAEVKALTPLTPRNVLNLTRIFQEAFTNVLKHAHADKVVLRSQMVTCDGRRMAVIALSDNGHWLAAPATLSHGLDNMRRRAHQLGGELLILRTPTGSTVELTLPVAKP